MSRPSEQLVEFVCDGLMELKPLSVVLQDAQDAGIGSVSVRRWQKWVSEDPALQVREARARMRACSLIQDRLLEELALDKPNKTRVVGWISMAAKLGAGSDGFARLVEEKKAMTQLAAQHRIRYILSNVKERVAALPAPAEREGES